VWSNTQTSQTIVVNTPGFYSVTVTDANGCSGISDALFVEQGTNPDPIIYASSNGTLNTQPIFTTYQWKYNGSNIPGATTSTYIPTIDGTYTITVTNANGCTGTSGSYTFETDLSDDDNNDNNGVEPPTNSLEDISAQVIEIYPNPVLNGLLTVSSATPINVTVLTTDGKIVNASVRSIDAHTQNIDLSKTAAGVYLVKITDKNDVLIKIERVSVVK
jgi:hypothetical protein